MVQVLPETGFASSFKESFQPAFQDAFGKYQQKQDKKDEFAADEQNYKTIEDAFGKKFANVWKAAPTGARTELLRSGVDANLRGYDIKRLFGEEMPQEEKAEKPEREFPEYQLPTEGQTPKETIAFQKELRGYNDPIFKESIKSAKTAKEDLKSFKDLEKLSGKIPQGLSRFFYDKEGNIRPLAQTLKAVPPEAEEYVKIINNFTSRAKDSYGSRVTNFDLQQFMRRLPTLANSPEGRKLIIDRMRITSEADEAVNNALKDVYRHYGMGKITPEDALNIAEQIAEQRLNEVRQQAEQLDEQMNILSPDQQPTQEQPSQQTQQRKSLQEILG